MQKELMVYHDKDDADMKYRENLFKPDSNKMHEELIENLDDYEELEGVAGYEIPSKFDFNEKASHVGLPL
jgi:hypothetical protein